MIHAHPRYHPAPEAAKIQKDVGDCRLGKRTVCRVEAEGNGMRLGLLPAYHEPDAGMEPANH